MGLRVAQAVQPVLEEWVEGVKLRHLSFHAVQVVTGHGCFGYYLHCIGKECTAQHTLEFCPAWADERRALRAQIGEDLSLPAVIAAAARIGEAGRENWRAFVSFCEKVMSRKEADERVRRREAAPPQPDSE
ncbi:uncharacterized protein [Temnothorax nylanderi]|uniref:uncharacterized protein n=1 Tax=Temnothorax nylanderi TaxID=102681 RepID=UPI003A879DB5